jgi:Spy/CpxP family protein refolding chaperone
MKASSGFLRKTLLAAVASVGFAAAVPQAFADSPADYPGYGPGYGMGPGMMGGYGPGYGMGPGMMGGYGPGYGMGPGMMWGYGGYGGMGPGMMRGYGRGYGGYGPGWMMGGCAGYGGYGWAGLNLTDQQREKIAKIEQDTAQKQWELMSKMHEQGYKMRELYASGQPDDAALKQAFDTMSALRKQMFENGLEARKQIDAVLTKEQREKLGRG